MTQIVFSRIAWFVLLVLAQALVFNHIHLFGCATPMPYVYFLLLLPASTPRWAYLIIGFLLGLTVDIFSSTPGMTAASMCFTALLTPVFISIFAATDRDSDTFVPSLRSMELSAYLQLSAFVVATNTLAYFLIEAFTMANWGRTLLCAACSTLLTLCLILTTDYIRDGGRKR